MENNLNINVLLEAGLKPLNERDKSHFESSLEFINLMAWKRYSSIADIGSGPGHQAFVFRHIGMNPVCIDHVQPVYDIEWVKPEDATERKFDAIWSHHCLEHIANPISALIKWNSMLRPRGELLLTVPEIGMNMSTGHLVSYNIPLLIYHLAIAGFDCSGKRFSKSRSHIRAWVQKSDRYDPNKVPIVHDLKKLADFGLFSPSVAEAIRRKGRFSAADIHLVWNNKAFVPAKNAIETYEFITSHMWNKRG